MGIYYIRQSGGLTHTTYLCTAQRVDATSQELGAGHRVTAVGSLLGGHPVCEDVHVCGLIISLIYIRHKNKGDMDDDDSGGQRERAP